MMSRERACARIAEIVGSSDVSYSRWDRDFKVRCGFTTFELKRGLSKAVKRIAANRRWVRRRDAVVGVLRFFGVRIEDRCRLANEVMARVFGSVPPLERQG